MKVALYGRHLEDILPLLQNYHQLEIVTENPDVVISHGGDGSLLGAELAYPGITKCPIRDVRHNPKCEKHSIEFVLESLVNGTLSVTHAERVQATVVGKPYPTITALNDLCINKANIASAVRFRLWINDDLEYSQIVGDGLIVSTVFGSTGYYRSITKSLFRVGIGLAFNNSTEPLDHLVIPSDSVVKVEILRGPAVLLGDNDPTRVPLEVGDCVLVQRSPIVTPILGLEIFRCRYCFARRADGMHLYLPSNPTEY